MGMKAMEDLREMLCAELDEIARKQEMNAGDLETVHKLTDTIKNIDKIEMLEDGGYSEAGDWEADMRGTYGHGSSYRGRNRDSMGRYSRDGHDGGVSYRGSRRISRGGYSRSDGRKEMVEQMESMMNEASTDHERDIIRRAMEELRQA